MSKLDEIADAYLRVAMSRDPFEASMYGLDEFDAVVPDVTESAEARDAAEVRRLSRDLAAIKPDVLIGQDVFTLRVLEHELARQRSEIRARWPEFTVDASFTGPQARAFSSVPKVELATPAQLDAYLLRCSRLPGYFTQSQERLRAGLVARRLPTERGTLNAIRQIKDYLDRPLPDDPFGAAGTRAEGADDAWRTSLFEVLSQQVRPALARYREMLTAEVLPVARPDDKVGLVHIPDGPEVYQQAIACHTTLPLSPDELHRLGLDLVGELRVEVSRLGSRLFGVIEVPDVFGRLRDATENRFETADEILEVNRQAVRKAEAVAGTVIGHAPRFSCRVEAMDPLEAASGAMAYYQPPRWQDGRGGTYWVNTLSPTSRARNEYEALAFHEGVPGHHTQISIGQAIDGLPLFRRVCYIPAYSEGWALYAERLADELGLYSDDAARLGMLSFALWRACRLVVDSGLHWLGWSRQQAVAYMRSNTGLTSANIDNEIDRYIAWPGQATGYMVGCQEIFRLRREAERRLGSAFDLRYFHSLVLDNGPLTLPALAWEVESWLNRTASAGQSTAGAAETDDVPPR